MTVSDVFVRFRAFSNVFGRFRTFSGRFRAQPSYPTSYYNVLARRHLPPKFMVEAITSWKDSAEWKSLIVQRIPGKIFQKDLPEGSQKDTLVS